MAKNKTVQTDEKVVDFINRVSDGEKRLDCQRIAELIQEETGLKPKMWGPSIVGFGSYHYRYESGREGDAPLIGFSPRSKAISLYLTCDFDQKQELIQRLGTFKIGKACIYIKRLEDVHLDVLREMVRQSVDYLKGKYNYSFK